MLANAPMQMVRIIVLKRDADRVTEALGRLGVLELTGADPESQVTADTGEAVARTQQCAELKSRLESLMERLRVPLPEAGGEESRQRMTPQQIAALADALQKTTSQVGETLAGLDRDIRDAQDTMDRIAPYRDLSVSPKRLAETSFLHVMAGDMPPEQVTAAQSALPKDTALVTVGPGEGSRPALRSVLALSSRRSRFAMRTVLEEHQFSEHELPADCESAPMVIYQEAAARCDALTASRVAAQAPLLHVGHSNQQQLQDAYRAVCRDLRVCEAGQNYASTWATTIISGWALADQVQRVQQAVQEVTNGRAIFEAREVTPEEIEEGVVPSYAELPGMLRPFQGLVRGFGEPGYSEIEPTVLFAASFLLMFGLVFGDLGHGLCLLAIGLLTRRLGKDEATRNIGFVIAAAGIASALFGAFFQGAFFGLSLKEAGWWTLGIEPIRLGGPRAEAARQVIRYLIIAVTLGIVMISLGVVLNIVTRLRRGDYEGGLLGKFGLVGMLFYWGSLGMGVKLAVAGRQAGDVWLFAGLVALPLVVLAFHEPIYSLITRRKGLWREGPLMGLFEGALEAMEAVMTYVANTFSFLRVAAFALSHAALCFTIFVMMKVVMDLQLPAAPIWAALIFVIGTAVIIGLEGLIVTIQIFRLEYYEFFTKFFRGDGRSFHPFRLDEEQR